jgi:hypothetical protein
VGQSPLLEDRPYFPAGHPPKTRGKMIPFCPDAIIG